jgi:hypothetical protein
VVELAEEGQDRGILGAAMLPDFSAGVR